jgi:hypothetical protein
VECGLGAYVPASHWLHVEAPGAALTWPAVQATVSPSELSW